MEHQEQQIWAADEPTGAAAWQAETTDGWTRVVDDRKQRGIDCAPTTRSIWAPPTMRTELVASDSRFPEGLRHVEAPPGCIRLLGDPALLTRPALAIVGARKASPYGLEAAGHFARCAVLRGITIVSGGAIGCDQAAHRGALDAGGRTIVVLGCGADIIYPMRARGLFERVLAEDGTIISEAPWGSPPSKWGFRRRNRLIAGLAQATLIVEAGLPSGTFSTADATLAQGKDVLAIPGSIFAPESRGANRLIAQGAVPIVDDAGFEDALTMIFGQSEQPKEPSDQESEGGARDSREGGHRESESGEWDSREGNSRQSEGGARDSEKRDDAFTKTYEEPYKISPERDPLLSILSQKPCIPERLIGVCGENVVEVIRCLSSLELAGAVVRLRDGRYAPTGF